MSYSDTEKKEKHEKKNKGDEKVSKLINYICRTQKKMVYNSFPEINGRYEKNIYGNLEKPINVSVLRILIKSIG